MGDAAPKSRHFFTGFLIVATIALSALVIVLTRENRALRTQIEAVSARQIPADAIKQGETVTGLTLTGTDGNARELAFGVGGAPTVVFMVGTHCGYCEETIPRYANAVTLASVPGLRVACIQADAKVPADLKPTPAVLPAYLVQDGRETWLRRVPMVPSAVVIDSNGVVVHVALGQLNDLQGDQLLTSMLTVR